MLFLDFVFRGGAEKAPETNEKEKLLIDFKLAPRPNAKHPEREEARLISFVNTIAEKSPFGKAVLEEAARNGYTLGFENQSGSCGFCEKENKVIMLNPRMSDNLLIATLAHEARHAQQFANGAIEEFGYYNVKDDLKYNRAMEADAETAAAATCYEIRANGNAGPWKAFAKDSRDISFGLMNGAASSGAGKGKITTPMLQGAFNGWYKDTAMVEGYEEGYVQDVMNDAMENKEEQYLPYDAKVSSAEIVTRFCKDAAGKCYWADRPDVLDSPEKLSVCAETVNVADKFFESREKRFGMKPDTSYKNLPVRDPENLDHPRAASEKSRVSPVAIRLMAGKKQR